jgi:hypothetical protein
MTLEKQISEWRKDLSNSGLYYAADVATHMVEWDVLLPEGQDNPDMWVMVQGIKQMMSALDECNMKSVIESLKELEDQSQVLQCRGGEYAVRVLNEDGTETEAGKCLKEIMQDLSDYPVLDDAEYSQWEYDNQLEIIRDTARGMRDELPENWDELVWKWLWDNEQGSMDVSTDEGFIDEDAISRAIVALGFNETEEE